jgi:hypothetical protein
VARVATPPSWSALEGNHGSTVAQSADARLPAQRTPPAQPAPASRMPSWTSLDNLTQNRLPKAPVGPMPAPVRTPSLSPLGGNSSEIRAVPTIGNPGPTLSSSPRAAPSWFGLGRGSSAPSFTSHAAPAAAPAPAATSRSSGTSSSSSGGKR